MPRLLLALLCVTSAAAFAQQPPPRTAHKPPAVQHLSFDEDGILGETQGPDLTVHTARPGAKFESLIKVRDNFDKELLQSVYAL